MDEETSVKVKNLISGMMDRIIRKRTVLEPFNENDIKNENPIGYRLVPIEIWKGAKFERSFVTSLGQGVLEQLAKVIAEGTGAVAENQHVFEGTINTWRKEKIDEILNSQRNNERKPNWNSEVDEVLSLENNRYENIRVRFDLYIKRTDGSEEFYSIKTVKPNLDQTEIAKRDMLHIKACNTTSNVYFALPFNPAGEGYDYRQVHSIPYKLFNMDKDESVLIGSKFWNKVGNDNETYNELLGIFEELGADYSKKIRKEYLKLKL